MALSEVPYIRWAKSAGQRGRHRLTMSAVPPVGWHEIGLDPSSLQLFEFTPYGPTEVMDDISDLWGVDPAGVLLASSASHAHFCFAAALAGPGKTVVHEVPGYLPIVDALSVVGVNTVPFPRRFDQQYRIDLDLLARTVADNSAAVVLLTNLHNPSGVRLSVEEEQGIAVIAEEEGCHVIVDEMYRPFLDPDPGPLCRRHPSIISIGGLNKVHGVSQIRFGWGMATEPLVDLARRVFDSTTLHNSCLTDQVARAAMKRYQPLRQRGLTFATEGWKVFSRWLEQYSIELVAPAGGLVCFPRVPIAGLDGDQFQRRCLEHGVNLTPGRFFGASDHVRIAFGLAKEPLQEALEALGEVIER